MKRHWLIFTDLDGTLLDHGTYAWDDAAEALKAVGDRDIPLIICSSKTRAEIEELRERIGLHGPFVVENGGGIYVPAGGNATLLEGSEKADGYERLTLGHPYSKLRAALQQIAQETKTSARGYGDMSPDEISRLTGLSREAALRSQQREFDEPFILEGTPEQKSRFLGAVAVAGLNWTRGGRFYHLTGRHDKGRAVQTLIQSYEKIMDPIASVGIGDSLNDLPMLEVVDFPILVQKSGGIFDPTVNVPGIHRQEGVGPVGWNRAVLDLLKRDERF